MMRQNHQDQDDNEAPSLKVAHCTVPRTARYFILEPAEPVTEIVLAIHGYAQSARSFLLEVRPALHPGQRIVAPEGLSRFYRRGVEGDVVASWMTREDRLAEIDDHCRFLDQVWEEIVAPLGDPVVRVLGFSQGVATVTRWLARSAFPVRQLILWTGTIPQDGTMEALGARFTGRLDLVYGSRDPVVQFPEPRTLRPLMDDVGYARQIHRFAGGHHLDQQLLQRLLEI